MTPIVTIVNSLFGELAKHARFWGFCNAQSYLLTCFIRGPSATEISKVPPFFTAPLHSTALHPVRANTQTWPFKSLEVGANGEGQPC